MSLLDAPEAKDRGRGQPLPPVSPPTGTFILQLFLIPLLIVTIVVVLWLLFSWVAHMGRDNASDLVRAIERGDSWSGQRAYELADLLSTSDPRYDKLRKDSELAQRLAHFLERDLEEPVSRSEWKQVMRRMYLCRALGSFSVPDGLPTLLKAATQERDPVEVEVRFSALEAIAMLADNCGKQAFQENEEVMEVLLVASRETSEVPPPKPASSEEPTAYRPHAELRAVAAYALGVIGGEQATERLVLMLHDAHPNARFNAATGLARAGDIRCEMVLREMLDPANPAAVQDETNPQDQARKRTTVLVNGIKATLQLADAQSGGDLTALKSSLQKLASSPLDNVLIERSKVKSAATEVLRLMEKRE